MKTAIFLLLAISLSIPSFALTEKQKNRKVSALSSEISTLERELSRARGGTKDWRRELTKKKDELDRAEANLVSVRKAIGLAKVVKKTYSEAEGEKLAQAEKIVTEARESLAVYSAEFQAAKKSEADLEDKLDAKRKELEKLEELEVDGEDEEEKPVKQHPSHKQNSHPSAGAQEAP
jgi:chromosome segregation ATPase